MQHNINSTVCNLKALAKADRRQNENKPCVSENLHIMHVD